MSSKIYKYEIPTCENFSLDLPKSSQILRVDNIGGFNYLWAIVNTEKEFEVRNFKMYKTGQEMDSFNSLIYLGTCKLYVGEELCVYVFEKI